MADDHEPDLFGMDDEMDADIPAESQAQIRFALDAERFAKALDSISRGARTHTEKRADIIKLVNRYHDVATEKVNILRESSRYSRTSLQRSIDESSQDSMDVDEAEGARIDEDLQHWELEKQTWDLLRRLLPLRCPDRKVPQPKRRDVTKFQDSSQLWEEFLQSDSTAQERKAIMECMQEFSDETSMDIDEMVREYQTKAERGDIVAYGWLHTRTAIKMTKQMQGYIGSLDPNAARMTEDHRNSTKTDPLVTQLDPDVVTRQNRKLEPQDEYFERAIWLGCYELLRRGRSMSEIRDWCVERTEVWRAVSMSAMPLSKDKEGERTVSNPLATLLWRRTCYALARNGGTDDFERAVYGILSGDIPSVEKVCETWDDFVFAHYNALLRSQFDSYVAKCSSPESVQAATQSLPVFNALQFHGDGAPVGERVVQYLETNPKTAEEARDPIKALQGAVISDSVSQYAYDNGLALGRHANKDGASALIPDFSHSQFKLDDDKYFSLPQPNGLRVLVHALLLISNLEELQGGSLIKQDLRSAQENVLAAYVSALRLHNLVELIPIYCAKIQGERAFFTLSRNVSMITDEEERRTILTIMEKIGMDIAEFVIFQPRSLLKEYPETGNELRSGALNMFLDEMPSLKYGRRLRPDFFGEMPELLDPVDEQLIQSLEWMMLVDGLGDEILAMGVAIYKRFLKSYNLHAARALSERVRCADIFRAKAGVTIAEDTDLSWFSDFDANVPLDDEAYAGPRDMVTARNFLELECMIRVLDSMETVASSQEIAQDPTSKMNREFWVHIGQEIKQIKSFVEPCLRGWLRESIDGRFVGDHDRQLNSNAVADEEDFEILRDMYLPETVLGYVSVLHFAGTNLSRENLLECMELAATIAEKDSDIASVLMRSGRMKELVEGFANSSKALAVSATDKKGGVGASSKKMRELGWSRELWSVKR
ncbi:Nucleoporin NUP84 [Apiospora saccharicola]|uniref:Nuclear pore complex protein n=1 Tax=Apiospora saccharicola TaxID=335842 RepID=A0ABR1WHA6_9PEZI